ncbi:MAG: FKBP-type peptidyl-prolyl cis-trans isomerase [Chitinophagales bacterium]
MHKYHFISLFLLLLSFSSCTERSGYQISPNGLEYKIIVDNKQSKSQPGQYISYHVFWRTLKDSLLFSSENVNQPLISLVARPISKGDLWEIFTYLGPGDSASCRVPARNIFKSYLPSNMKRDDLMKVDFKVLGVLSQKQIDSMQSLRASQQLNAEDQELQNYMRRNNLSGSKTPSGLYVVIEKQGSGKQPEKGNTVKVNYTGKLLDGTQFDSSLHPGREPFEFVIGTGQVIRAWDEGLTYFKPGGKGKLIIPSNLAYGEQGAPPKIGPNQPLVFDIELVSIK